MSVSATNRFRTPCSESTKKKIGSANNKHKIEDARKLRDMVKSGYSQKQAAFLLGFCTNTASRIIRNLTYKESNYV